MAARIVPRRVAPTDSTLLRPRGGSAPTTSYVAVPSSPLGAYLSPLLIPDDKPAATSAAAPELCFATVQRTSSRGGVTLALTDPDDPTSTVRIGHRATEGTVLFVGQSLAFAVVVGKGGDREACAPLWLCFSLSGRSDWGEYFGVVHSVFNDGSCAIECPEVLDIYGEDPVARARVSRLANLEVGDQVCFSVDRRDHGESPQISDIVWKDHSNLLAPSGGAPGAPIDEYGGASEAAVSEGEPAEVDEEAYGSAVEQVKEEPVQVDEETFASTVERVKAVQRSDGGRELWRVWCDARPGKRDPALRPYEELGAFLDSTEQGAGGDFAERLAAVSQAALSIYASFGQSATGAAATPRSTSAASRVSDADQMKLITCVKAFQKRPGGNELWRAFCERRGGGKRDPAARKVSELREFLDEMNVNGDGPLFSGPVGEHERLLLQVRQGLKDSEPYRVAWRKYCNVFPMTPKPGDPSKHTLGSLQAFVSRAPQTTEENEDHNALVMKIKQGQRTSDEFRAAWQTFCAEQGGGKSDPAKHETSFLQEFLESKQARRARPRTATFNAFGGGNRRWTRYRPY